METILADDIMIWRKEKMGSKTGTGSLELNNKRLYDKYDKTYYLESFK
jgi:hypothetical protein